MTPHQKAMDWLIYGMEIGVRYNVSEKQKPILLDVFFSGINLPTCPTKGYDYYFDISMNFTHIRKNPIKNPHPIKK